MRKAHNVGILKHFKTGSKNLDSNWSFKWQRRQVLKVKGRKKILKFPKVMLLELIFYHIFQNVLIRLTLIGSVQVVSLLIFSLLSMNTVWVVKYVYAYSQCTHYISCTHVLGFLPHQRCMGPLCSPCRWKVCGKVANRTETKEFFLLHALAHWSNLKDSCSAPGCPKASDLIFIPPSIQSIFLGIDSWKYQKGKRQGPTGVVQRVEDMFDTAHYPVYAALKYSNTRLSQVPRLIKQDDFSVAAKRREGLSIIKGCKCKAL